MGKKTNLKMSLAISVFLAGFVPVVAGGGTIYVDVNAPGPTHDGSSWTNAYNYLQDALNKPPARGDQQPKETSF